jgi:hypothetical protein
MALLPTLGPDARTLDGRAGIQVGTGREGRPADSSPDRQVCCTALGKLGQATHARTQGIITEVQ